MERGGFGNRLNKNSYFHEWKMENNRIDGGSINREEKILKR